MGIKDKMKIFGLLSQVKDERLKKSLTKACVGNMAVSTISSSLEKNISASFYNVGKNKYV